MSEPQRLVLLGHPVAHTLSPIIQNAALRSAGIELQYEALDITAEQLAPTLAELAQDKGGGNITIPHKRAALNSMMSCTTVAAAVGAVNCFKPDGKGNLIGHNTDVAGFNALAESIGAPRKGARVAVIGSGGGAAAVLTAIKDWPNASARLYARNRSAAAALAQRFSDVASVTDAGTQDPVSGDLVVNATPIGLTDDSFPVELDRLEPSAIIVDLAYRAGETAWIRAARARGHRAADGITMLVEQAASAFAWWFGMEPDRPAMWAALKRKSPG